METFRRKRLEIVVEAPMLEALERMLGEIGVTGYTVVAGREGSGSSGRWIEEGFTSAFEKRIVIAVTTADTAEKVFARLKTFFQRYSGVVFASDVDVMRAEKF
jgi:hypothetical protein